MPPQAKLALKLFAFLAFFFPATVENLSFAAEWNQFRGPTGQGTVETDQLPLQWSEEQNIGWKTAIHDKGWSSPIVCQDKIWMTTASEDGRKLYVVVVQAKDGTILWDRQLFTIADPQFAHKFNSYASPTPVSDGSRVYVTFGSPGTACLDAQTGELVWERTDIVCNHFRGAGSSPILFQDLLIMNFDGSDHQFIMALDAATGETRWQTQRSIDYMDLDPDGLPEADGDWRKGFSTPHVAELEGQQRLLSIGSKALYAYEPLTGKEIWHTESRIGHSASSRPTIHRNQIYYLTGFSKGELWAIQPGGHGHVTDTHVRWTFKRSVPNKPSMIAHEDCLFMIHDGGVASCVDTLTGEAVWQERIGGNYSASPIRWKKHIYFFSEEGKTSIIEASKNFVLKHTNQLDGGFMASPAIVDQSLILRSKSHLYRIHP